MERTRPLLLLSVPLALGACFLGHALGYRLAGEPASEQGMHGYLAQAPLPAACLACLALTALALRASGRLRGGPSPLLFSLLAPLAFATQETAERLAAGVPLHTLLAPAVGAGLAAQLPLALAAWMLARLLLCAVDAVSAAFARGSRPRIRPRRPRLHPTVTEGLRPRVLALGYAGRAPPAA